MSSLLSSKTVDKFDNLPQEQLTANKMVFTSLINGIGYAKISRILAEMDCPVCSEYFFNKRMDELYTQILDTAVLSCKEALKLSTDNKTVSFDGMWSSPRNAPYHIVDLFDVDTGKVIDFQFVTTCTCKNIKSHTNVTTVQNKSSVEFEAEGLKQIRSRSAFSEGTKYYVHDVDLKAKAIVTKKNMDLRFTERFDYNHLIKAVFKEARKPGKPLYGLYGQLRSKYIYTFKNVEDPNKRAEFFMNKYDELCKALEAKNKLTQENMDTLKKTMQDASDWLKYLETKFHTNNNESLHSDIARFAPKNILFRVTWPMRAALAIIKRNHPENWMVILRNVIGAPLPKNDSCQIYKNLSLKSQLDHIARQSPENIEKRKQYRAKKLNRVNSPKKDVYLKNSALEKPQQSFTKPRLFGAADIILPQNWKNYAFFIHSIDNNIEELQNYLNSIEPMIYRVNEKSCSAIFVSSILHGKSDPFSLSGVDEKIFSAALITDDNFIQVLHDVPLNLIYIVLDLFYQSKLIK